MNVVENLYEYLKHNDRAEIPNLGTFVVKTTSAQINELSGTIDPPCRKVIFEKTFDNNKDFINFMAQREFISPATAETWIKQSADSWASKLEKGETIELLNLGTLKKGYLGEYSFVAESGLNLMDDAFALEMLKNVKTYERPATNKVDLIHTKQEPIKDIEETKVVETKEDITESAPLSQENRVDETEEQTLERISQHEATEIQTQASKPVNLSEKEEKLDTDISLPEQKTEQTVEIKQETPQQETIPQEQSNKEAVLVEEKSNKYDLQEEAERILNKHGHDNKKIKIRRKSKKAWKVIFWFVVVLLLLCALFVGAHYMGWLKDIKPLKPITDKLSCYIPIRQKEVKQPIAQPMQSITEEQTEQPLEVSPTQVLQEEILDYESINKPTKQARKNNTATNKKKQVNEATTQPQQAPVEEDNSPVLVQNHSKLGFDVIGGTFDSKKKAESAVRKAKSLGYDSYVLSKIKNGSPIYYVSYGSRRTLQEANNLMQSMMTKMGGSYYVISR